MVKLTMPAKNFATLLQANPELSFEIHRAHARELCGQVGRIGEMCRLSALQRLEGALHSFARSLGVQREGHAVELTLPIHRWELAEFIGVTPEHLSRVLKVMEKKGLIARERSRIVIHDVRRFGKLNHASAGTAALVA
jgi:CRP-like cAMP-binding protein